MGEQESSELGKRRLIGNGVTQVLSLSLTELLERVFLRLGGAETDEQLQSTLERFLVPTILKSGSEFKSVQNKVFFVSYSSLSGKGFS